MIQTQECEIILYQDTSARSQEGVGENMTLQIVYDGNLLGAVIE
jgi:hypothetical protein